MAKKRYIAWLPVLGYAGLIFLVSSFSVNLSQGTDKVIHVFEYALMGFLITRAVFLTWDLSKPIGILLGASLGTALGLFDEFHQYFVPGRNASWADGLADLIGATLGALLFVYFGVLLFKTDKLYPCEKKRAGDSLLCSIPIKTDGH